jgi:hypothetical protein
MINYILGSTHNWWLFFRTGKFFGKDVIVPPLIGTAQKPRDGQSIIDLSNNETYLNYIDMLISESLVSFFSSRQKLENVVH